MKRNLENSKSGLPFLDVFVRCAQGIGRGKLIRRESRQDKEFHFQNWFRARLAETKLNFEVGGRNTYPDFRLVATTDGFEVKGLAYPGREANYDCISQVPSGNHNGRTIYYVFGRYPAEPDGDVPVTAAGLGGCCACCGCTIGGCAHICCIGIAMPTPNAI